MRAGSDFEFVIRFSVASMLASWDDGPLRPEASTVVAGGRIQLRLLSSNVCSQGNRNVTTVVLLRAVLPVHPGPCR